jgi:hypothetical protein
MNLSAKTGLSSKEFLDVEDANHELLFIINLRRFFLI